MKIIFKNRQNVPFWAKNVAAMYFTEEGWMISGMIHVVVVVEFHGAWDSHLLRILTLTIGIHARMNERRSVPRRCVGCLQE